MSSPSSYCPARQDLAYLPSNSKAKANVEAVDERQQLERLRREEKTASRTTTSQRDKLDQLREKRQKLADDSTVHVEKQREVRVDCCPMARGFLSIMIVRDESQGSSRRFSRSQTELGEFSSRTSQDHVGGFLYVFL